LSYAKIMNKVAIVGPGGSGKSTLASKLGIILNLPVYHLDKYFWKPGWVKTEHEEWLKINDELIKRDEWIIDGNYRSTMEERFKEADTIIFLDFNRFFCLYRAYKRYFQFYGKVRTDITEGCYEKMDIAYIWWIWIYTSRSRPNTIQNIELYGKDKNIYIFKNSRQVKDFLNNRWVGKEEGLIKINQTV
jgi:adenylate kinase family enzyme